MSSAAFVKQSDGTETVRSPSQTHQRGQCCCSSNQRSSVHTLAEPRQAKAALLAADDRAALCFSFQENGARKRPSVPEPAGSQAESRLVKMAALE